MRQQNDRRIIGDLRQRGAEIVDADAPHRPETARREIGELIAEAGQPERTPVLGEALGVVFVNRNAGRLQRAAGDGVALAFALHFLVFPPVVIAENGVHAERRLQPGRAPAPIRSAGMKRVTLRCPAT